MSSPLTSLFMVNTVEYPSGNGLFDSSENQFGILKIKTVDAAPADSTSLRALHDSVLDSSIPTWNIGFSIDISGSMSDICKDGRNKMAHIKHTISNILRLFSETQTMVLNVYVQVFDNEVKGIIPFTKVTPGNVEELVQKVQEIYPKGSTNLKLPIECMNRIMEKRMREFPFQKFAHIMLTDGEDTSNNTNNTIISEVSTLYKNVFVGFGATHNSVLMSAMSKDSNNEYWFIDKLESSGFVYGEIIHGILYSAVENVSILVDDGEIYNWRTNTWETTINVGSLPYGVEKTFHVRTTDPELFSGKVFGAVDLSGIQETLDEFELLPRVINCDTNIYEEVDLTKYLYRQRVQELLYMSKNAHDQDLSKLKSQLREFFIHMKEYVKTMLLTEDLFWKVLLDDLFITYKTLGSPCSHMYTNSRQSSQGRQQTYAVTNLDDYTLETQMFSPPERNVNFLGRQSRLGTQTILTQATADVDDETSTLEYNYAKRDQFDMQDSERLTIDTTLPYDYTTLPSPPALRRSSAIGRVPIDPLLLLDDEHQGATFPDYEELQHELSDNTETSYATQQIMSVMRSVSQHTSASDYAADDNV
jgi:uncharacterized protein YegL